MSTMFGHLFFEEAPLKSRMVTEIRTKRKAKRQKKQSSIVVDIDFMRPDRYEDVKIGFSSDIRWSDYQTGLSLL